MRGFASQNNSNRVDPSQVMTKVFGTHGSLNYDFPGPTLGILGGLRGRNCYRFDIGTFFGTVDGF